MASWINRRLLEFRCWIFLYVAIFIQPSQGNWASEASPTLGCSIEISRDIYIYVVGMSYVCRMSN